MAPYVGLLHGMTREEKQVVVAYLVDIMDETSPTRQVPLAFKKLRGMVSITPEEIAQDEHLAHIMER